jgi:Tfp pilus assembly protein PilF
MKRESLEEALTAFRQAVEIDPEDPMARIALAHGLQQKGDLEGALNEADQALLVDPKNGGAHHRKGYILEALGDTKRAMNEFERAVELGVPIALLDLAELQQEAGNIGKARQYLHQFISEAKKPENNDVLDLTSYVEEAQSMLKELG